MSAYAMATDERDYQRRRWDKLSDEVIWETASDSLGCPYTGAYSFAAMSSRMASGSSE